MLRFAAWICCAAAAVLFMPQGSPAAQKNVLMIVADDLGFQLGCYGDKNIQTPNIDRLAAGGTRFTRAHCTTASCSASRSVMMTGCYNHSTAHYGHEHNPHHFRTFEQMKALPVLLGEAGYRTCSIGKYHLAPESVYHFERYGAGNGAPPQSGLDAGVVRMAEVAGQFMSEKDPRPFFLYFCSIEPHRRGPTGFGNEKPTPGVTPVKYDPARMQVPPWLPDQPEVRQELAEYYEAISRLDQAVGVLLQGLEASGHADDTMVLFLSDNGPPFPGAKTTLYEPGSNLPLIIRRPGQTPVVNDALVNWADLAPTIAAFCGLKTPAKPYRTAKQPIPSSFQGRSLLGILDQEHPAGWDELFASHTFHEVVNYYPMRSVRVKDLKYIFNVAHQLAFPFASDLYASPTWQAVLKRGDKTYGQRTVAAYMQRPRHELYDLAADPGETKNLADDPAYATALSELQAKLKAWQQATRDPWVSKWEYE